jgi:uncharacterized protein
VRAVLGPNVVISAVLSPGGSPAKLLHAWEGGEFEVVVCPALLDELARALAYPKLRQHITQVEAEEIVSWIAGSAVTVADPPMPPRTRSADPADDYLIALAAATHAMLVSGDRHLLDLADAMPVYSPRALIELLESGRGEAGS